MMKETKIYQTIAALLSRHTRPNESLVQALYPLAKLRMYEPKDLFTSRGDIPDRIAYLFAGAAVAYKNIGKQRQLVRLWKEDELLMHTASLFQPQKSDVDILFCSEAQTLEIRVKDLYRFQQEHTEITPYFGHFVSGEFKKLTDHICWLKTTKAQDRIHFFQQEYPTHNMFLPDEHKAQYLNMSVRWYQEKK